MEYTEASNTSEETHAGSTPVTPTHEASNNCYAQGCRLPECREEHRIYNKERARIRRRPDSGWDNPLVDVAATREHILKLVEQGMGLRRMGQLVRMQQKDLLRIKNGPTKKVQKKTQEKILALTFQPRWVDPTEAREHLIFLQRNGIGTVRVMNATGINHRHLYSIRSGVTKGISKETESKILAAGLHKFRKGHHLDRPHLAIAALPENLVCMDDQRKAG